MPFDPTQSLTFLPNQTSNQTLNFIISERFLNCALRAYETSDLGSYPYSSRQLVDHLKLNLTFTVGSMQSIMPNFGVTEQLQPETEILFYLKLSKTVGKFLEKGQLIRVSGNVLATFVVAENRSMVYEANIQFQGSVNVSLWTAKEANRTRRYHVRAQIEDIRAQVIPNPDKIDPDVTDYQLSENLNSILLFLRRWVNSMLEKEGSIY